MSRENEIGVAKIRLALYRMRSIAVLMDEIKQSSFYLDDDWEDIDDAESLMRMCERTYSSLFERYKTAFGFSDQKAFEITEDYISSLYSREHGEH
jgi:hypothetical protein